MLTKKLSLVNCAFLALLLGACDKEEIADNVPDCIEDKIEAFAEGQFVCEDGASVVEYLFQGKLVYAFFPGNCIADGTYDVLSEDCDTLCTLGGIAGLDICNDVRFSQEAVEQRVVWEN